MSKTATALKDLHAALVADGFDPGVDWKTLAGLLMAGVDTLDPDPEEDPADDDENAEDRLYIACERASAGIYYALNPKQLGPKKKA